MKCIALLILAISVSLTGLAQKIHFTDTTNIWSELAVYSTGGPPVFNYGEYSYVGDSTVDSVHYTRFSFGLFREDTVLKKVFTRRDSNEVVLMDYNLVTGDTFVIDANPFYTCQYVVSGIDSTLINSIWHKVWYFSRFDTTVTLPNWCCVIEGVGCMQEPTYMLNPMGIMGEYGYYMYCFSNRGTTPPFSPPVNGINNTSSCTYYPTLAVNSTYTNSELSIYPNPAHDQITITGTKPITNILITNCVGHMVSSEKFNEPTVTLPVNSLATGLYLVTITDSDGTKTVKKVIKE